MRAGWSILFGLFLAAGFIVWVGALVQLVAGVFGP